MHWRAGFIIATVLIAIFGIPSLPRAHSHLIYWGSAFVLEIVLHLWLKPHANGPTRYRS